MLVWLFIFNFLLSFFFNSDIIWTDTVTRFSYTSVEIVPKGSEILIHKLREEKKTLALRSQTPARTSGRSRFLREFLLHNENTKKGNVWGDGMVLKPRHLGRKKKES